MKKFLSIICMMMIFVVSSCTYDDTSVWNKLEELDNRVTALEELCKQLNTNIDAMQTLVEALEKEDYITNVAPIYEDGDVIGYTITFAHSDTITIYNGKDGKNGANGADGENGKDGYTPQIGVMQDEDGLYYWTIDGKWLLDAEGNKIHAGGANGKDGADGKDGKDGADGEDGKDGQNGADGKDGKDGITPRLKIENGYWYVSYDEGATWVELGEATGDNNTTINNINVTFDNKYVYFEFADGTVMVVPHQSYLIAISTNDLVFDYNEESATIDVVTSAKWALYIETADASWLSATPEEGKGNKSVTITVAANSNPQPRTAYIKFNTFEADGGESDNWCYLTIYQSGDTSQFIYNDNFDGAEATKSFGTTSSSWPYINEFPEFANAAGLGAENVTYSGSYITVRNNSNSNGGYSDYEGSGVNNLFFGPDAYFQINDIALPEGQTDYTLTFGSEKYLNGGDSTFNTEEFHVYLSKDGAAWAEIDYTFAGTNPGRWNVATANFSLAEAANTLYIKFVADVASCYRLDDVTLRIGDGGEEVVFPNNITIGNAINAENGTEVTIENATVIGVYARGILIDDTTGKLVVYTGKAVEVEVGDVVTVEGSMTTYAALRQISGEITITKTGTTDYTYPTATVMDGAAMDAYLTNPYIEYVEYTGTLAINGNYYNVAVEGAETAMGSISYPIEGTVDTAWDGTTIVVKGWTIGFTGTKYVNTMVSSVTPAEGTTTPEVQKVTIEEFINAAEDNTVYELTGVITNVTNTTYGNFYINDGTGEVLIYGLCSPIGETMYWEASGAKVGDTITVQTVRSSYNGTPQGKNAIFVSLVAGEGGDEEPTPDGVVKATVAEFLVAAEDDTVYELTGVITRVANTTYGNFDLTDDTGTVYIYGLCSPIGEIMYWEASGAKVGDTITVQTVRSSYNGTPQGKNAIFVSLVAGEGGTEEPEPEPAPATDAYVSDAAFICATDDSTNAVYSLGDTAINGSAVTGFKLGKSKQTGLFTSGAVGVEGDKYLNLYAAAWKGGDATLYFRVDGGATQSLTLVANDGATSNPPYTALTFAATDHYSVKLTGLTANSTIEFSTDPNFELTTADATISYARAIVCGVKLTDEPIVVE